MSHYVLVHGQDYCLPSTQATLPELLPERFTRKAHVGKWHLGHSRSSCLPTNRGYDAFHGYYLGSIDFYGMDNNEVCCCDEICEPARSHGSFNSTHSDIHDLEVEAGDYITDSLTKAAISEIESFDLSGDSSLFLTVAMAATHNGPFGDPQYKESDIDPSVAAKSKKRAGFSAMAKNLDENVERLHSALATKGILDDTLIVILSDNGGETSAGSSVYPFRGEKFTYFNGGIRPPAAIFGAGVKGGGAFDDLFWIGDVAPTILEAVGGEIPRGVDGRSHWSAISRPEETSVPFSRSDPFVSGVDPVREAGAVFHGRYKLVVNGTAGYDIDFDKPELGGWVKPGDADGESVEQGVVDEIMLFNLERDEQERTNLVRVLPEVAKVCLLAFQESLSKFKLLERQTKERGGGLGRVTPGVEGYGPWVNNC